jgi:hypothetical protein
VPNEAVGIAVNSDGDAAVVGYPGYGLEIPPATPGAYNSCVAADDDACAFVTELNPTGTGPIFSANFYSQFFPAGGDTIYLCFIGASYLRLFQDPRPSVMIYRAAATGGPFLTDNGCIGTLAAGADCIENVNFCARKNRQSHHQTTDYRRREGKPATYRSDGHYGHRRAGISWFTVTAQEVVRYRFPR